MNSITVITLNTGCFKCFAHINHELLLINLMEMARLLLKFSQKA